MKLYVILFRFQLGLAYIYDGNSKTECLITQSTVKHISKRLEINEYMTSKIILVITILGFIAALIWLCTKPEWESLVTSLGLLAALITQLFTNEKKDVGKTIMRQRGGKNSKNYQSKGDINING